MILWLIERQDYLKAPPTKAYLFVAVKRAVMERARSSYIERTVWADSQALVDLEEMRYAHEHGRARTRSMLLVAFVDVARLMWCSGYRMCARRHGCCLPNRHPGKTASGSAP